LNTLQAIDYSDHLEDLTSSATTSLVISSMSKASAPSLESWSTLVRYGSGFRRVH